MANGSVDAVLKLQQEFEAKRKEAIEGFLSDIRHAQDGLKVLGYQPSDPKKTKAKLKKVCPRCGAADHDARFHRGDKSTTVADVPADP